MAPSRAGTSNPRHWPFGLEALFVAALGALHSLPFVATWAWPLQLLVIGLFVACVVHATPRRAAALGLAFGTSWLAAGTW